MRVIGLTGTIGAGKSTMARWLRGLGAWTVDADALAHRLYDTDRHLLEQVQARFGADVVAGGRLDRRALARRVFGQPDAMAALEALVHPAVHRLEDEEIARAASAGAPACVVEAVKMVESGGSSRCDELWIVVAPEVEQFRRLAGRGMSEDEVRARLAAQGTVASWVARFLEESARLGRTRPVVIFDNGGTEAQGQAQVLRLWAGIAGDVPASGR